MPWVPQPHFLSLNPLLHPPFLFPTFLLKLSFLSPSRCQSSLNLIPSFYPRLPEGSSKSTLHFPFPLPLYTFSIFPSPNFSFLPHKPRLNSKPCILLDYHSSTSLFLSLILQFFLSPAHSLLLPATLVIVHPPRYHTVMYEPPTLQVSVGGGRA